MPRQKSDRRCPIKHIYFCNSHCISFDFIKCDRFWEKGIEGDIPTIRYFGNAFASFLAKFSTGNWRVNDPLNGLFGFSKTSLENFRLPKLF